MKSKRGGGKTSRLPHSQLLKSGVIIRLFHSSEGQYLTADKKGKKKTEKDGSKNKKKDGGMGKKQDSIAEKEKMADNKEESKPIRSSAAVVRRAFNFQRTDNIAETAPTAQSTIEIKAPTAAETKDSSKVLRANSSWYSVIFYPRYSVLLMPSQVLRCSPILNTPCSPIPGTPFHQS